MRHIDEQYTKTPVYGYRRMTAWLRTQGMPVNRKRVSRLMKIMGLEAIYPKPSLSKRDKEHEIYPYLLRGVEIVRVNQVWSTDITYIRMEKGFVYLVAIIDWHSRYVLDWEVSVTMDPEFCCATLARALLRGLPEIFNTDQTLHTPFLYGDGKDVGENGQFMPDGVGRDLFQASVPVRCNVLPLNRGIRAFRQGVTLPDPDPHGFLDSPFLRRNHFSFVSVKGFGKGCVFGLLL